MADVVVYTRPGCLLCQQVMDMLWEAQVPFREVDAVSPEEQKATIDEYKAKGFPLVVVDGVELGGYAHVLRLHSQGRLKHLGAVGQGSGAGGADADAPERMTWAERMSRLYAATRPR